MALIQYVAKLAVDKDTGLPLPELQGQGGTIIKRGQPSSIPTIYEDDEGNLAIPGSVMSVDGNSFVPSFYVDENDLPISWWNGATEVPLESVEGVAKRMEEIGAEVTVARAAAEDAAQAAQDAADLVEAPADDAVATLLSDPESLSSAALDGLRTTNGARPVGKGELVVNVKDFGAVGDGVTDDTVAIQDALDAAGVEVLVPAGTYVVGGLTVPAGITVRGQGRSATTLLAASPDGTILNASGPSISGTVASLTADATPGDASLTVDSTAAINAGDWLLLFDTRIPDSAEPTHTNGELIQVASVDSATSVSLVVPSDITSAPSASRGVQGAFDGASISGIGPYLVSAGAGLRAAPLHIGTSIRSLTVRNPSPGTGVGVGIDVGRTHGASVVDVEVSGIDGPAINAAHAVAFSVAGCYLHDLSNDPTNGRFGYGVNVGGGTTGAIVSDCQAARLRHFFTTGGSAAGGTPRNITVANCRVDGSDAGAFDTHTGINIEFSGCVATNVNGHAFNARARNVTFRGCHALRPGGHGFQIAGGSAYGARILGCLVTDAGGHGVYINSAGLRDVDIADTIVDGCGTTGIHVGFGCQNVRVTRCRVYNVGQASAANGLAVTNLYGTVSTPGLAVLDCTFARTKTYGSGNYRSAIFVANPTYVPSPVMSGNVAWGLDNSLDLVSGVDSSAALWNNVRLDGLGTSPAGHVVTSTTASLASASSRVNTGKRAGAVVFNTDTSKPVYATGSATTSPWVDATGATAHTPA